MSQVFNARIVLTDNKKCSKLVVYDPMKRLKSNFPFGVIFLQGGRSMKKTPTTNFYLSFTQIKISKRKIMRNLWGFCNFSKRVNVIPNNFQLGSKANKIWERSRKKISWIDGLIYSSANITKNQNKLTPKMKTHIRKCL